MCTWSSGGWVETTCYYLLLPLTTPVRLSGASSTGRRSLSRKPTTSLGFLKVWGGITNRSQNRNNGQERDRAAVGFLGVFFLYLKPCRA